MHSLVLLEVQSNLHRVIHFRTIPKLEGFFLLVLVLLSDLCTLWIPCTSETSEVLPTLADCIENVGTSTSQNPMGFHGLLQG
jgi:hypothetical protein